MLLMLARRLARSTTILPACRFGEKVLANAPVIMAKRDFGRGKKIHIFGHATIKSSKVDLVGPMLVFAVFVAVVSSLDWKYLQNRFGIPIPSVVKFFSVDEDLIDDTRTSKPMSSSLPIIYEEKKREIHEAMLAEAKQRYMEEVKALAMQDEELADLIEGRQSAVITSDKEAYEMKKKFVADYMKQLKAETVHNQTDVSPKTSFRTRKIVEYENRLRQYSTPDKVFRYFATIMVTQDKGNQEVMMTPEDFLRSISPGSRQPENLGLDQFAVMTFDEFLRSPSKPDIDKDSIFHQFGSGGLISFSDYIFLLTVLSTSRRHFEIAFKMFDLNGDGNVDAKEFEVVTSLMKNQSSIGGRHRDHQGSTFKGINSGLITYFFGKRKDGILTVEKFLRFQRRLQNEILRLEFNRKTGHEKKMSEKDFADLLIAYAGFPAKKRAKMLKRVKKAFKTSAERGISLQDYLNFYQVLYAINDVETALTFHHMAGAAIERSTMKHVAQTVADVQLSDHVVDVVFVLFDGNGDGKLSNKEFVSVMKQRAMRGLEKPKDTGIGRLFSALAICAFESRPAVVGGSRKTE